MAIKEKRVVQSIMVCDFCDNDIQGETSTRIEGQAIGYMKREGLALDLCENCATIVGLKRRGRRPSTTNEGQAVKKVTPKAKVMVAAEGAAPKKRGRPRKVQVEEKPDQLVDANADEW